MAPLLLSVFSLSPPFCVLSILCWARKTWLALGELCISHLESSPRLRAGCWKLCDLCEARKKAELPGRAHRS